jgi:hypothetical protein
MKTTALAITVIGLLCGCDLTGTHLAADGEITRPASPVELAPNTSTNPVVVPTAGPVREAVSAPVAPPDLPGPVQEVVRLAQTTLGDGVLLGFIDNIKEPYGLNADQIIYLNDLGLSESVIKDLIKHSSGAPTAVVTAPPNTNLSSVPVTGRATPPALPAKIPGSDIGAAPTAPMVQYDTVPPTNYVVAPAPQPATQQVFYDSLSPYGQWVDDPDYGQVWQPTVAVVNPSWQPYCDNGYWVWTDCGWYWSSSYSWGWAPFHYGRWCRAPRRGWCWVPDTCWGPAWVTWRTCDSHCGWAPLPPRCAWSPTLGLTYHGDRVGVGFGFGLSYDSYVYVGWGHFCDRRPWQHCAPRSEVVALHSQSRVINDVHGNGNTVVNVRGNNNTVIINNGPGLAPAQAHARTEIPRLTVADARTPQATALPTRPGAASGVVAAYRPVMSTASPTASPSPNTPPVSTRTSAPTPNRANLAPATAPSSPARPYIGATTPRVEPAPRPAVSSVPQPSLTPNVSARPRTVPRPTPIAGPPNDTLHEVNQRASPRSEIASTAPVRPSAPMERAPTGIFAPSAESAVHSPGSIPSRESVSAQNFPSGARTPLPGNPNAPAYRYYNPSGNNAPVARYYPGASAPVHAVPGPVPGPIHGGSSGYSSPVGAPPTVTHGAPGNSGGAGSPARGNRNGR